MNIEEIKKSINEEVEKFVSYYKSLDEVVKIKLRNLLQLPDDANDNHIQTLLNKTTSKNKKNKAQEIINQSEYAKLEAAISLRTLNWVLSLMEEQKEEVIEE